MTSPSSSDLPPPPVSQIRSIFEGIAAAKNTNNSPATKVVPLPPPTPASSRPRLPTNAPADDHPSHSSVDLTQALKRPPPPLPTSAPLTRAGSSASSHGGALAASALPAEYPQANPPTASAHFAPLVPSRLQTTRSAVAQPSGILKSASSEKDAPFTDSPVVETTPNVRPSAIARPSPIPPPVPSRSAQLSRHSTGTKLNGNSNAQDDEIVEATLSSATVALAQRKAPPPPPSRRPFTSSRSPSPQPPSPKPSDAPELPLRSKAPRLGHAYSNSRDAKSVQLLGELEDNSSFATTSMSGSSLLSHTNSLTSSSSGLDETPDEIERTPGQRPRRGSMPSASGQNNLFTVQPLERAVTEAPGIIKTPRNQAPAPPPRMSLGNRPNVPPRPAARNVTPTQHLIVPHHSGSPTPPPLPARGGGERSVSDDDASSASSATAIPNGAPLPPPRRMVPSDPSSSASPPPSHPSIGKGPISASPQGAKLYSAINK
ncbi:hypothetical protein FRB90_007330, partial [Tulasnella sp. 427]